MRRFLVPVSILAVAIGAFVLAARADDTADQTTTDGEQSSVPRTATPLLSATRTPEWLRQPESDAALETAVAAVLPSEGVAASCITVHRDGMPVASENPDVAVVPGQLQRLVTAAAAFDILSRDDTFTTDVVMQGGVEIAEGELRGDVWIVGRGDPTLSTPSFIDRFADTRARTDLNALADDVAAALVERGVTTITGSVLGDESRYPIPQRDYTGEQLRGGGPVWTAADVAANSVGPLSALLVDNGFESWPAEVDPPLNQRSVVDPPTTAAGRMSDLLIARGIAVQGAPGNQDAPDRREVLATVESPARDNVVARALIDGTTAEMLMKELGVRSGGEGARDDAIFSAVLGAFIRLELPGGEIAIEDASGLSAGNRLPCPTLAALLDHPDVGASIVTAMPEAAATSLAPCLPSGADDLRLLASAAGDQTSLAGVFTADNGDVISFVMMASAPDLAPFAPCNPIQAALLDTVAGHPYGPELETIVPLPAVTE